MADEANNSTNDEQAAANPEPQAESNTISQDELDALAAQMQQSQAGDTPASASEGNRISQEELDALAAQMAGDKPPANAAPSAAAPQPQSNLIDQAELDALAQQLQQASGSAGSAAAPAPTPVAAIAADDAGDGADLEAEMAAIIAAEATAAGTGGATTASAGEADPAAEMAAAIAAEAAQAAQSAGRAEPTVIGSSVAVKPEDAAPLDIPELPSEQDQAALSALDLLDDVELDVKIELGRTQMYIEDVLRLGDGSVVELDKLAGDPVDIFVNERLIARGEVLVLNDNFCVRINDIISSTPEPQESTQ